MSADGRKARYSQRCRSSIVIFGYAAACKEGEETIRKGLQEILHHPSSTQDHNPEELLQSPTQSPSYRGTLRQKQHKHVAIPGLPILTHSELSCQGEQQPSTFSLCLAQILPLLKGCHGVPARSSTQTQVQDASAFPACQAHSSFCSPPTIFSQSRTKPWSLPRPRSKSAGKLQLVASHLKGCSLIKFRPTTINPGRRPSREQRMQDRQGALSSRGILCPLCSAKAKDSQHTMHWLYRRHQSEGKTPLLSVSRGAQTFHQHTVI